MKENGHNDLDRLLKEQLGDRQAGVPEFVWEKIEERIYPEKKRRGLFRWWFFGAGLLVIAGVWGVIRISDEKAMDARVHATEKSKNGASGAFRDISGSRKQVLETGDHRESLYSSDVRKAEIGSKKNVVTRDISEASHRKTTGHKRPQGAILLGSQTEAPSKTKNLVTRYISESQEEARGEEINGKNVVPADRATQPDLSQHPRPNEIPTRKIENIKEQVVADRFKELWSSLAQSQSETAPDSVTALSPRWPLSGNTDTLSPLPKPDALSRFSILAYGGPSFYDMANIRPYFETGQLSRRTFDASGFEAGLGGAFRVSDRFFVYALGSFNRKQASHRYTFAISEDDYFGYTLEGEKLPFENIDDNGNDDCFLAKDATATYTVTTWSAAVGAGFTVLRLGKWSLDADLRFSVNAASALHVKETTVIALPDSEKERFSWYQPGAGLTVQYQLNKRLSVGIAPLYSHRFHRNESSFSKKLDEVIVPVVVRIEI